MFNNSTKRHSFRKMATDKKYIPLKKTEKFINGNYSLLGKSQILDLAAILTLNDLYYIMSHSESCDKYFKRYFSFRPTF